ncbi:MAG TPA: HisA/HisF-related TIM barrel protein [bacterium]|nr:HisA/HisF-related TIM barrel protein [bacterium]
MIIIPAIDLKKSKVVRLHKGRFEYITSYQVDPEEILKDFILKGTRRIHIVSLLGAKDGEIPQEDLKTIEDMVKIKNIIAPDKCKIQIGGGLRKIQAINRLFDIGVDYVIIGTAIILSQLLELNFSLGDIAKAYNFADKKFSAEKEIPEPDLIDRINAEIKKRIIISIDVSRTSIALSGWFVTIPVEPAYVIKKLVEKGFSRFIITDTAKDGTLSGINIELFSQIINKTIELIGKKDDIEFIIGGGITTYKDMEEIAESKMPIFGVVIGKALYEQKLQLHTLIKNFQRP